MLFKFDFATRLNRSNRFIDSVVDDGVLHFGRNGFVKDE